MKFLLLINWIRMIKEHLQFLSRPELGITFTKINSWLLLQYSKCVFIDSDCLVLRSIDDLFDREQFSAVPDAGWRDCFNSGDFVYRPSKETFNKLLLFASQNNASFDGSFLFLFFLIFLLFSLSVDDQGLLNSFVSNWHKKKTFSTSIICLQRQHQRVLFEYMFGYTVNQK